MDKTQLKQLITENTLLCVVPQGLPELLKTLSSDAGYVEVAETVAKFPSITARLLFLANSAWASPPVPIVSLEMACARLGLPLVRSISLALCVAAPFNTTRCKAFNGERFWSSAMLVAECAAMLASYIPEFSQQDIKTIHTASLLHNLGLLWMVDNLPEETGKALVLSAKDDSISTLDSLLETVGTDYCEVGEVLGKAWALPDVLITVMAQHANLNYTASNAQFSIIVGYATLMLPSLHLESKDRWVINKNTALPLSSSQQAEVYEKLEDKHGEYQELARLIFSS